jgi:hypothetical protein
MDHLRCRGGTAIFGGLQRFPLPCSIAAPASRLDPTEKRRSRVFVIACSGWVPDTHASVTPLRGIFRASRIAGLTGGAQTAMLHGNESCSRADESRPPGAMEPAFRLNAFRKFGVPGKSAGIWLRRRALRAARLTAQPETASDAPSPAWGDEVGPRACCDRPRETRFPAPSSGLAKQLDFGRNSISEFPNGISL